MLYIKFLDPRMTVLYLKTKSLFIRLYRVCVH